MRHQPRDEGGGEDRRKRSRRVCLRVRVSPTVPDRQTLFAVNPCGRPGSHPVAAGTSILGGTLQHGHGTRRDTEHTFPGDTQKEGPPSGCTHVTSCRRGSTFGPTSRRDIQKRRAEGTVRWSTQHSPVARGCDLIEACEDRKCHPRAPLGLLLGESMDTLRHLTSGLVPHASGVVGPRRQSGTLDARR